ncbi:MAG: acetate--CoA ligase family protein [Burkholderiales bacterium]|nr:acetate--CoA ligase family protein [Burkholderiales bacterium]
MPEFTQEQFEHFTRPRSLAVIGVSERTGPQAYNLVENLDEAGASCRIYPVNIRAAEIAGRRAYRSVIEIPEVVELAVISTPREAVAGALRQCVHKGIRSVVVATQGFADADAEGVRLQRELDGILAGTGTRLIGPNTIGVANLLDGFHTSFQKFDLSANATAWLCQSGTFVLGAAEFSGGLGIGIDIGNGADVGFADLLPWVARDPRIKVINLHIEGLRHAAQFLAAAARITPVKPVVVYKTGRSEAGARAALSHSGSLSGEDHVFDAAFRKAGILRAGSVEELADLNKALLTYDGIAGRRIGVVTISGGAGIAAVDALGAHGLEVASLSPQSRARLQPLFPSWFEVDNPVDFWPAAMRGGYRETCAAVLDALLADPGVDAVLFVIAAYRATGLAVIGPVLAAVAERAAVHRDKPVAFWVFGANQDEAIAEAERRGPLAGFRSPERAARALAGLDRYASAARAAARTPAQISGVQPATVASILGGFTATDPEVAGAATLAMLEAYGVPVATARLALDARGAAVLGEEMGYPLVMKIASPDIVHKSDAGGVMLNIRDRAQLRDAYAQMLARTRQARPQARIEGVHLQRYLANGTEVIIGARRDPEFGVVLLFGLGGIFTEAIRDVAFRLAPLSESEAHEMLREIRGCAVLQGARGRPAANEAALVDCLLRVSRLMEDFPRIMELDVNPLSAGAQGAIALDARAVLAPSSR